MNVEGQIKNYIASQPDAKRSDMQALRLPTLRALPACKLWFEDGKTAKIKLLATLISDMDFIQ